MVKLHLTRVRDLLARPKDWVQGTMYADRFGNPVSKDKATCRCLMAAMYDVVGGRGTADGRERYESLEAALEGYYPQCSLAKFNDDPGTTHEDVLRVLDEAIAHA